MSDDQIHEVAKRIADYLFVNDTGEEAHRLVLTSAHGKNLGGWCKEAVVSNIIEVLVEAKA